MVTADSVREDYCFTEAGGFKTTPYLEEIAAEGIRFKNAISSGPRTAASVPEFLTGELMPYKEVESREHRFQLIEHMITKYDTLPERLAREGYETAAVTANPYTTTKVSFEEVFDNFCAEGEYRSPDIKDHFSNETARQFIDILNQYHNNLHWFVQWPDFYDDIQNTVEELSEPYFLWVFLLDTHNPYIAPSKDRKESSLFEMYYALLKSNQLNPSGSTQSSIGRSISESLELKVKKAYRDTIRSVDRFIKTIQEDFKESDPVLVFNSDHGEAFYEHGTYGHHSQLYEENINVPLIIYDGEQQADIENPVSLRSLPDMIFEYATGQSHFDDTKWQEKFTISRDQTGGIALRERKWKYITRKGDNKLFNLENDPEEKEDLSDDKPEKIKYMQQHVEEVLDNIDFQRATPSGEKLDPELVNRLESLEYVED